MKFLLILDWTLWSTLLIALIYALVAILTERNRNPEADSGLGVFLILLGIAFSAATGTALYWLAQKQAITVLVLMTAVLAWPLMPVVARPLILTSKNWWHTHKKTPSGNLSVS